MKTDYARRLSIGQSQCEDIINDAVSSLVSPSISNLLPIKQCLLINEVRQK